MEPDCSYLSCPEILDPEDNPQDQPIEENIHQQESLPHHPFASLSLSLSLPSLLHSPTKPSTSPSSLSPFISHLKIPSQISSLTLSTGSSQPNSRPASRKPSNFSSPTPLKSPSPFLRRRPSDPSSGAAARCTSVVWFRSDLRLHDNEAIASAHSESSTILPVFLFDPRDFGKSAAGFDRTGPYRAQFLVQSVADLRSSLRSRGSDLVVRIGKPETVLVELAKAVGADAVYAHREVSSDEVKAEEGVEKAMEGEGIEVKYYWGSTLFHVEDLPFDLERMPTNYGGFREKVKGVRVRKTIEALDQVRGMPAQGDVEVGEVPSLRDLGLSPQPLAQDGKASVGASLKGGETEALEKLKQRSGVVPGVGLVHAPIALLPMPFPENYWSQACELTPIFNELVDRVSLDGKFLQDSLSRTKKVDAFTSRLLDIHSKMLEINKKEDIRLGLHRSDYMLDAETNLLLQIELNTISSSFPGLSCLVSELHRNLLNQYEMHLGLDSRKVPGNTAVSQFAVALAKAWKEYDNNRAIVLVVVQPEERNMYDQHWLCSKLKESHGIASIRKTLAEINAEGELMPDGSFLIGGKTVAVVYFRAGYAPNDYPSESEWGARFLIEKSDAIKCPSISYHLVGTKKIQQELSKPNVLERFLENKDDIAKLRKCFAGLWSLDNPEGVNGAMERPELFVLKPQREGGGNNIYGEDVRKTLVKLQQEGSEEQAAYILMQRIFPRASNAYLVREGICHQDQVISELGIYGAYVRNKDKVVMNEQCGYLMRTKVSSSNEGGVAAGYAVLDSVYLT